VGIGPVRCRELLYRSIAAVAPRRRFLRDGPAGCGSACLTFDDGPHPEHTPRLLDALGEHGVAATFFVVGRRARRHPGLVRRIAAEGHEVGNHTFTHPEPWRVSTRRLLAEVRHTGGLLADLLGRETCLFRPPYGRVSAPQLWGLWRAGQAVVLWDADPRDFSRGSAEEVREWFRSRPLRGGSLVLLHDDRPHAGAVMPDLAASARALGLAFTTVGTWAGGPPG
jgi:peptidoglycan-N-acetylglucosamine deacetylase